MDARGVSLAFPKRLARAAQSNRDSSSYRKSSNPPPDARPSFHNKHGFRTSDGIAVTERVIRNDTGLGCEQVDFVAVGPGYSDDGRHRKILPEYPQKPFLRVANGVVDCVHRALAVNTRPRCRSRYRRAIMNLVAVFCQISAKERFHIFVFQRRVSRGSKGKRRVRGWGARWVLCGVISSDRHTASPPACRRALRELHYHTANDQQSKTNGLTICLALVEDHAVADSFLLQLSWS